MNTDTPLTEATSNELTLAVENNLCELFRAMTDVLPDAELHQAEGRIMHHAFPVNPMFKGVWKTHLATGDVDTAITETLAWFRERKAPFMFWWTGPGTEPTDLGERLMAYGLISMEEQQKALAHGIVQTAAGAPCMIADLNAMNESALQQVPDGFIIEEVSDEASLQEFKQVFQKGYEVPEWAAQAWVDATTSAGISTAPWKMYLGRLNGEAVATNILFNGAGVASVYGVTTLPEVRGKGIGGAITLKPLLDARDAGYRYGVLFSSEMGIRAYERIGFTMTDARINRYMWRDGN